MKYLITSVLCVILLAACKQEPTTPTTQNQPDYFPLQIGNWWEYAKDTLDSKGNFVFDQTIRCEIIADSLVNNIQYFKIKNYYLGPSNGIEIFIYKDTNGTIIAIDDIIPTQPPVGSSGVITCFNKPIDEPWNFFQKDDDPNNPLLCRIESKTDSTHVPAGFFYPNCVIGSPYQRFGPATYPCYHVEFVYSPNIGLVKLRPTLGYGGSCVDTQFSLIKAHIGGVSYP